MKIVKKLGLWMDNSIAYIIEFVKEPFQINTITSGFTHFEKESTLANSEKHRHNKEQQLQNEYYKKLAGIIANNDEVVLFGPTAAKTELLNILRKDSRFDNIKIEVKLADQMTPNQKLAFVRDYFSDN